MVAKREQRLERLLRSPVSLTVTAGFDGYVDAIARVCRERLPDGSKRYFTTMGEFGAYISGKAGKSGSLELEKSVTKIGGNMPNYARALSMLGVKVNCIGAMGYPRVSEVFRTLGEHCTLYTVCEPGTCDALEFEDGKLMLAESHGIEALDYDLLRTRIPPETIRALFGGSDLITMLNWSEMRGATSIWRGILDEVSPGPAGPAGKPLFLDFSDCSGKPAEEIAEVVSLVNRFGERFRVVVSLNRNEAEQMLEKLELAAGSERDMALRLYEAFGCGILLLHLTDGCYYVEGAADGLVPNKVIERPVMLTGGGDNFNAGFTYAWLSGLALEEALLVANAVSGYYVSTGESPDRETLLNWMKEHHYMKLCEKEKSL